MEKGEPEAALGAAAAGDFPEMGPMDGLKLEDPIATLKLEAVADHLVVDPDVGRETTYGSMQLIIPDVAREEPCVGLVLEAGPDVKRAKVGDHVVFGKYAGTKVKLQQREYLILKDEDVLSRVVEVVDPEQRDGPEAQR